MMPKKVSVKTVGQNIRTEKLAENASEKTTIKMIVLECCPNCIHKNSRFCGTFLGNIRIKMVAEKPFEKTTNKKRTIWNAAEKLYPQKQSFKRSVLIC